MGHEPVVVPLFDVMSVAWEMPDPAGFDAVVMTSANAARHGGAGLRHLVGLPVYAVGEATAAAARAAGFGDVRVGDGDVTALGPHLSGRILHLAGSDYRPIPTPADVTTVTVYTTQPLPASDPMHADAALVHSPRAGARLAEVVTDRAALHLVAISNAAAQASGSGWASVHIADRPRENAMLECLRRLCEASPQI